MITTIRKQLAEHGISLNASAYSSCTQAVLDYRISSAPFLDFVQNQQGRWQLVQKNVASAISKADAADAMQIQLPDRLPDLPWFCAGLERIADARRCGRPIAVEGGPCLFGTDEVRVEIVTGTEKCVFDYSTGRHYAHADANGSTLAAYLQANANSIQNIRFQDFKSGVTTQERDSILWLFQIARALQACVVLPLPDVSYGKYLYAITAALPEEIALQAQEDFSGIAHRIAGLYIAEAEKISANYPDITWCAVHGQSAALWQRFEEARRPYIERNKILRGITNTPEKLESIKDYISMPALPLYLWGVTDVLQVDSLDEIDSFRRCRRAHRRDLNLACMLYPERLSADGEHTIFQASRAYKEYL